MSCRAGSQERGWENTVATAWSAETKAQQGMEAPQDPKNFHFTAFLTSTVDFIRMFLYYIRKNIRCTNINTNIDK